MKRLWALLIAATVMATIITATTTTTPNPTATPTRTPQANATPTRNLTAPPPQTEWNRTFGGTGDDMAYSVQQTSDGGYIVAGYTYSFGAGSSDLWLVKADVSGNHEWNKTYGGTGDDWARSVQQTSDGGYIVAGYTSSLGAGMSDLWLVKTDVSGYHEWNKTYGGPLDDEAYSVQQTSDNGYIVAGTTRSFGAGSSDFWLVKTDVSGNLEWNRTYGGTGDDGVRSIRQISGGGYIVAGYTSSFGAGSNDYWLVKADVSGNHEWNKTYGGTGSEAAWSVRQTSDGGYIVAGYTYSFGAGSSDLWLVKTDVSGYHQWNKTYGGTINDEAYSVQQTSDNGYIVAGYTSSFGAGSNDLWLVKTDVSGNLEWNRTYGGTGSDGAVSVRQTSDGGYIVAGWTHSLGAGSNDFWLVKIQGGGAGAELPLIVIVGGVAAVAAVLAISIIVLKKRKA